MKFEKYDKEEFKEFLKLLLEQWYYEETCEWIEKMLKLAFVLVEMLMYYFDVKPDKIIAKFRKCAEKDIKKLKIKKKHRKKEIILPEIR